MAREPVAPEPGERRIRLDGEISNPNEARFVPFGLRTLPKRPDGKRPPDLTTDMARRALQAIASGAYQGTAALWIGVSPQTFSRWMHRKGEPYETFQSWVHEAEGQAEIALGSHLFKSAQTDWKAAVAMLERRFPERWAKVVAQPGAPVNLNLSATVMLQKIEDRSKSFVDPRGPREGQVTLAQVIEHVRSEPLALPVNTETNGTNGDEDEDG
jgi:hypothetical protein